MNKEKTIAKLKQYVQSGEIGGRRFQRYTALTAQFTNCFFHAVYNLSNKQILTLKLSCEDKEVFKGFFKNGDSAQAIADIKNFVEQTGLRFEECSYDSVVEKDSNKIAIFLQNDMMNCDFHLFREEKLKNGKTLWICKKGFSKKIEKTSYLDMKMNGMSFCGCFKITNPYAKQTKSNYPKTNSIIH